MDRQQDYVLRTIEDRDVKFVRLWFTDVIGTLTVSYTHLRAHET